MAPKVFRSDIAQGLRDLGVKRGDAVLLHSSLRSFGEVEQGADGVIDGFLDAVGAEGLVMAPTLTGGPQFSPENPPQLDLRTAPCWTGLIAETLRKRPGAIRSVHPTHSCAVLGGRAGELTHRHFLSPTPCGAFSPYFRLAQAGGYIAMAGCGLECCTTFHTVEELANAPYHLQMGVSFGACIGPDGQQVDTPCRLHSYHGPERDFPVMESVLLAKGSMRKGRIGASMLRLISAMELIELALDRVRFDPFYLTVYRGRGADWMAARARAQDTRLAGKLAEPG